MEHACIATDHKTVLYVATWSYMEPHIATYSYMYIHTARCICMELDVYTWSYVYIQMHNLAAGYKLQDSYPCPYIHVSALCMLYYARCTMSKIINIRYN